MLAGFRRHFRAGHMELVSHADDHCLHLRIRQHLLIVRIDAVRLIHRSHFPQQILRHVTHRLQVNIPRLGAADQMRCLIDDAASKDADSQTAILLFHVPVHNSLLRKSEPLPQALCAVCPKALSLSFRERSRT